MECLQTGMLDHACTYTYVKTETYMSPIRDVLVFVFAVIVTQTSQEHSMSKRCSKGTHALPLGIRLCQDFTFEATAIKGHRCGHACLWFIPVLAEAPLGGWISISWTAGLAFSSIEYNILQYYIESVALYCEGPIVYANLTGQPQTCTRSKDKEMLHRTPLSTFHPASIPPKSMVSLPSFLEYIQRHA
jgi:hypothetical protein